MGYTNLHPVPGMRFRKSSETTQFVVTYSSKWVSGGACRYLAIVERGSGFFTGSNVMSIGIASIQCVSTKVWRIVLDHCGLISRRW